MLFVLLDNGLMQTNPKSYFALFNQRSTALWLDSQSVEILRQEIDTVLDSSIMLAFIELIPLHSQPLLSGFVLFVHKRALVSDSA